MAIKIGITGGIGSGKSVVCRLMNLMGIPVYTSDDRSKHLMVSDEVIRRELTALLGSDAYKEGMPNKPLLASYLFASPDNAARINSIVHPRVKADFRRWVADFRDSEPLVAIESAILLEAGFASEVDVVLMVYAPFEVRVVRAMHRDAASREQIESRIRSQMDDEEKRRKAHHLIVNDGKTPLIPQVLSFISLLKTNNVLPLSAEKTGIF